MDKKAKPRRNRKSVKALRAFAGDATHRLPLGRAWAYKLWFEFLKLALTDSELKVDKAFYAGWGIITGERADNWFDKNWRDLFGVEIGVRIIGDKKAAHDALASSGRLVLSVASDQSIKKTLEQVRVVLRNSKAHARQRLKEKTAAAKYVIAAQNLKYEAFSKYLRAYRLWLANGRNIDKTARAYYKWSNDLNARIEKRNAERSKKGKGKWRDTVDQVGWDDTQAKARGEGHLAFEKYQQQIWSYIRKGRRIAANVAAGVFPGDYAD